jgi:predicted GIY-YIG superfamily endonuclease
MTRKDFRIKSPSAYSTVVSKGWLEEVCKYLPGSKPKGYWTKERCLEEALKYKTRVDFERNSISACVTARKNKWIDEICSHMIFIGNRYKRCIYAIEFSDNHVYVGLTYNIEARFRNHLRTDKSNRSSVRYHIDITGLCPKLIQLTEYIDTKEASELEGIEKNKYENNGWILLNRAKCGAVGGHNLIWTKEKCIEEASKYKTNKEFRMKSPKSYSACQSKGWLEEVCKNLEYTNNNNWTLEKCIEEALKYKTRKEFEKFGKGAYGKCVKKGWLDELYSNIPDINSFKK